jgi:hypothetical protein
MDRSRSHRRSQAGLSHQLARLDRLGHAALAEGDVLPAREEVLQVPGALPVPEEDEAAR